MKRRALHCPLAGLVLLAMFAAALAGAPRAMAQAPAPRSEFLYVLDDDPGGNRIFGYRVDGVNGQLTALPGFPMATGRPGDGNRQLFPVQRMAYDPTSRRLFVLNAGTSPAVTAYSVDPASGALSALPYTISLSSANSWLCLAVRPGGSPLLVGGVDPAAGPAGLVASYRVGATAASPAPGSPYSTGPAGDALPYSCAFGAGGAYFYTGGWGPSRFAGFRVNAATGALAALPGSPYASGLAFPLGIAADQAGRLFMAQGDAVGTQRLAAFTTSAGVPRPVTAAPLPSGLGQAVNGLWHPAGYYLVADYFGSAIGVYRVDGAGAATTLSAVSGSPVQTLGGITNLTLSRGGGLVFAASADARMVATYGFNTTNGALTRLREPLAPMVSGLITGMASVAPAPARTHGYVYALRDWAGGNRIYGFAADPVSGTLTPLAGFPVATGGDGGDPDDRVTPSLNRRLLVDAANRRLYVINNGSKTISAYAVDMLTGGISPLPFSPISLGPGQWYCLEAHPRGSPLIVGGEGAAAGRVASFVVGPASATPAPGSPYTAGGSAAQTCAITPDGAYFYGALPDILAFRVDARSGALTALPGSPFASGARLPAGLAADRAGRLLLADGGSIGPPESVVYSETVHAFALSAGAPRPVSAGAFPSGLKLAIDGLAHPAGYYITATPLYAATTIAEGALGVYRVQGAGAATTLSPAAGSPFLAGLYQRLSGEAGGRGVQALALDSSGRLIFASNSAGHTIVTFAFDPASGAVAGLSQLPFDSLSGSGWISGLGFLPIGPAEALTSVRLPMVSR